MKTHLPRIIPDRKCGSEKFRIGEKELDFDLLSFWQWGLSDLITNTKRGFLAEYIVARAIGLGVDDIANEWEAYDLTSPSGVKIEVKSSSFVQSWDQKDYSLVSFKYQAKRPWNPDTNILEDNPQRQADVYVFCLLAHKAQDTMDPMDLSQWEFYVVNRLKLDRRERSQYSITLKSLKEICSSVFYKDLADEIEKVAISAKE